MLKPVFVWISALILFIVRRDEIHIMPKFMIPLVKRCYQPLKRESWHCIVQLFIAHRSTRLVKTKFSFPRQNRPSQRTRTSNKASEKESSFSSRNRMFGGGVAIFQAYSMSSLSRRRPLFLNASAGKLGKETVMFGDSAC
ncbi:Uncharacterised protein [[Flavobacterium] thermophilum]|nr:hypothetical protein GARCT_03162 [Geobacillus sp. 12AMOR1]STO13675.1 Uncharacterised protein [[Flavobacterium] thermophilum]